MSKPDLGPHQPIIVGVTHCYACSEPAVGWANSAAPWVDFTDLRPACRIHGANLIYTPNLYALWSGSGGGSVTAISP